MREMHCRLDPRAARHHLVFILSRCSHSIEGVVRSILSFFPCKAFALTIQPACFFLVHVPIICRFSSGLANCQAFPCSSHPKSQCGILVLIANTDIVHFKTTVYNTDASSISSSSTINQFKQARPGTGFRQAWICLGPRTVQPLKPPGACLPIRPVLNTCPLLPTPVPISFFSSHDPLPT